MDLDRTPETIAYAAAEELRALNHRTLSSDVFTYPAEVQSTASGLNKLLQTLPQSLSQLTAGLDHVQQSQTLLSRDDTDVEQTVDEVRAAIESSAAHVKAAQRALEDVVNKLAVVGVRYVPDGDEELSNA
ncbi:hypothetical protein ACFWG5_34560 [Streptomyces hydrogenans]|uniref:hypothetical protein n=1 Tax=Streptomyces TaxID=1883 RepID=UPI003641C519